MPHKAISFFSLYYPFNISGSYLDKEKELLAQNYNRGIISSDNTFFEERRQTPVNAIVYRFTPFNFPVSWADAFKLVFKPYFCSELIGLVSRRRTVLSTAAIKEVFAFNSRSLRTYAFLLSAYPNALEVEKSIRYFCSLDSDTKSRLRRSAYNTWNTKYSTVVNNAALVSDICSVIQKRSH